MTTKEMIVGLVLVAIFASVTYIGYQNDAKKNRSISLNKFTTVGKVYKISIGRGFTNADYYFYYNNIKYSSWTKIDTNGDEYLNRFYKVNLSTENPDYSEIVLDNEITDSSEINKAVLKADSKTLYLEKYRMKE